ncbi:hypothetical protein [Ralstonia phage p2137]|nr:hypothetical protein [Ralstonia phage p2137]
MGNGPVGNPHSDGQDPCKGNHGATGWGVRWNTSTQFGLRRGLRVSQCVVDTVTIHPLS